jgi:hypothetical protein
MFRQYLPLFLEKQPYDDVILGPASKIGAKSLVAYDFVLYHYLMDREGQSISKEAMMRNITALIKVHKSAIRFVEEHPVDKSSTKFLFFKEQLPKMYSFGYKSFFDFPYEDNKRLTKEWDKWVRESNLAMKTRFVWLYRLMPYRLYWMLVKKLLKK